MDNMEKFEHKIIPVNGLNMHIAEVGQGPLILFVHGFLELWHSWRHQMIFMAERGYRAVAMDLRGYGDTTGAPLDDPSKFTVLHIVGDLVLLLDAIALNDEQQVFVVGHDWGANIAWHLCMYRPDRVKAFLSLSVPLLPRDPEMHLLDRFRDVYGDDHYACRFQEPGDIEAEFANLGVKEVIKNFAASRVRAPFYFRKGKGFGYSADKPSWLPEEELNCYADKFEQTGFTGALNYYRALALSWELNAAWTGAQVKVRSKLILGNQDMTHHIPGLDEYISEGGFKKDVPLLQEVVEIEGAGHFINRERQDEINEHMYAFFKQF